MTSMLGPEAGATVATLPPPSMAERITLIMEVFDQPHAVRTLEQVERHTRLPRSTTYRILDQLTRLQWIERTGAGYRLGRRSLGLGGREADHTALRTAAAPVLHDLALRTRLVVDLAVLDGVEVRYLDKVGGRSAASVPSRVGGTAPAHCTALGKTLLAGLEPERVDLDYARGLTRRTARGVGDLDGLHRELGRVRGERGLAYDRGECVPHIACVGKAVRGPDGAAGAISVVGEIRTPLDRLAPLVFEAAETIAGELMSTARGSVTGR